MFHHVVFRPSSFTPGFYFIFPLGKINSQCDLLITFSKKRRLLPQLSRAGSLYDVASLVDGEQFPYSYSIPMRLW